MARTRFSVMIAVCLACGAMPVAAKVSPPVGNALKDAQKLARSNPQAAQAKLQAARSAATTPEEKSKVSQMAAYVYATSGNYTALAQELVSSNASPLQIAKAYYAANNFAKAVDYGSRAGGAEGQLIVAQSYFQLGNTQKAAEAYKKLTTIAPKSEYFAQLASLQFKSGDKAGYRATLEKLIRRDPSPMNWKLLLGNLKNQPMADPAKLALFQLIAETGNLSNGGDYQEMAKLAMVTGAPSLAQTVLQDGMKSGKVPNDASTQSLARSAASRAPAASADMAKLSSSASGNDVARAGRTLYGMGKYPQAIALLQKSAGMGASAAEANLFLGLAQFRNGNKAGAISAFKAIPAGSVYADVGELWTLYLSIKG